MEYMCRLACTTGLLLEKKGKNLSYVQGNEKGIRHGATGPVVFGVSGRRHRSTLFRAASAVREDRQRGGERSSERKGRREKFQGRSVCSASGWGNTKVATRRAFLKTAGQGTLAAGLGFSLSESAGAKAAGVRKDASPAERITKELPILVAAEKPQATEYRCDVVVIGGGFANGTWNHFVPVVIL